MCVQCWNARSHGHTRDGKRSPEHRAWAAMIARCTNPNDPGWHNYGGRGIKVCKEWRDSFDVFFACVGQKPSKIYQLGRIDNDGGYEPDNVRWETPKQNARNTRKNHKLTAKGQTKTMAEWSSIYGIDTATMVGRLKLGWTEEETVTTPVGPSGPKRPRPFGFNFLTVIDAISSERLY